MDTLRRAGLAIALSILTIAAVLAAGHSLSTPLSFGRSVTPAPIGGAPSTNGSASPQRCSSSLGHDDYEACKVYFGE